MNGYELSRNFWNWAFDNPEKISPNHAAIYFFAVEHCNRLGGKEKFGFPSMMTMEAVGIKKHQTYIKYFNELIEFGFFKLIQKSQNQYSANIISLVYAMPKKDKALDKANIKHRAKQTETNGQSKDYIDKQINKGTKEQINYIALIDFFNNLTGKKTKVVNDKAKKQLNDRLKEGYNKNDIKTALINCYDDSYHKETNHKYLTLEFISRPDKFEKFFSMKPKQELTLGQKLNGKM